MVTLNAMLKPVRRVVPLLLLAAATACNVGGISFNLNIPTDNSTANASAKVAPATFKRSDDPLVANDIGVAPEFTNDTWLNTSKPLRLADLRGQVVLLEFWTFGCINCYHTLPAMRDLYDRYQGKGVQFATFHFPEFDYEHDINNVKKFLSDENIKYPVAIDNDGVAWNNYEMHAWPAFIIVDKQGHMRYRQIGEGRYDAIEEALKALLTE
jgi:thiol-disulfide isomerase/thioredoxin